MNRTAVLTTVANFDLYKKTARNFPRSSKYVFDGTKGMYGIHSILFLFNKLKGKGIKWLIMSDEDVIFKQPNLVYDIINQMEKENYSVCGVRDGGCVSHRNNNPYVINTFFSILNLEDIETIWNKKEMLSNQFIDINEFDDDLKSIRYDYDKKSLYEPYYCFYLWLRRKNRKLLFLDTYMLDDNISNVVLYKNQEVLTHTWYARSYGVNEKHTKRIDAILDTVKLNSEGDVDYILYKSNTFKLKQYIIKNYKRVKNKLFK